MKKGHIVYQGAANMAADYFAKGGYPCPELTNPADHLLDVITMGDKAETAAIKRVFGPQAKRLSVSSTKSQLGHTLGASGGIELVVCSLTIARGVITPTINYHTPDPACDLDYTPNTAREAKVGVAMSNSFGFGGHNASLVLARLDS